MSTQRQKKKNAQYKKKHHAQKAREDGPGAGKREVVAKASGRPSGDRERPQIPVPAQEKPPAPPDAGREEGNEYKDRQYSKREVLSNWEKYSEDGALDGGGDPESERELEKRLIQLLHLPTATHEAIGTLPGAKESFHALPPFLSLDCDALASSLSSLPLHQRLDLNLETLSMAEDSRTSPTSEQRAPSNPARLASRGGQPFTLEQFTFDFPSPDTLGQAAKGLPQRKPAPSQPSADQSVGHSSPPVDSPPKPRPPPSPGAVKVNEVPTAGQSASELDDILDELLA